MISLITLSHRVLSAVSGGLYPSEPALMQAYKKGFENPPPGASPHLGGLFNVYRQGAFDVTDEAHRHSLEIIRKTYIPK
jgi:hypothetical protein